MHLAARTALPRPIDFVFLFELPPAPLEQKMDMRVPKPSIAQIVRETLLSFPKITLDDLRSQTRRYRIVDARRACYRAVRDARPDLNCRQIGRFFRRSHTVVWLDLNRPPKARKKRGPKPPSI